MYVGIQYKRLVESCKWIGDACLCHMIQHSYCFTDHYQKCPDKRCWEFQQCSLLGSESHRTAAVNQRKTKLNHQRKIVNRSDSTQIWYVNTFWNHHLSLTQKHSMSWIRTWNTWNTVQYLFRRFRRCINIQDNDGVMEEAVWIQATNDENRQQHI